MKVAIQEIPEEGLAFHFSSSDWLPDSIRSTGAVAAKLMVYNRGRRILVEGEFSLQVVGSCDRCLGEMHIPIATDFQLNFERLEEVDLRGEQFLGQEEMDTDFIDATEIDLFGILQQQLYLSLPVKQLCKESCRGLCSKCGMDLNKGSCQCPQETDSPFGALAGLLKER